MIQSSLSIPTFQIVHDQTIDFKRVFTIKNPDMSLRDISAIIPFFEIFENGLLKIQISGTDIIKTNNSEIIVRKIKSFFENLDCLKDYTFRFYDADSGSILAKGNFKIQ